MIKTNDDKIKTAKGNFYHTFFLNKQLLLCDISTSIKR